MPVFQTNRNQKFDKDGNLLDEEVVEVDVTKPAVTFDLAVKARSAVKANESFLAIDTPSNAQVSAQVRRLTRQVTTVIRLQGEVIAGLEDLLDDNSGT